VLSIRTMPFYSATSKSSSFSTSSPTLVIVCLLHCSYLVAMKCCITLVLLCLPIMADCDEHVSHVYQPFVCILWRNVCSDFCSFLIWLFFFIMGTKSSIYILSTSLFLELRFTNTLCIL
jgi:hypothetical protein